MVGQMKVGSKTEGLGVVSGQRTGWGEQFEQYSFGCKMCLGEMVAFEFECKVKETATVIFERFKEMILCQRCYINIS